MRNIPKIFLRSFENEVLDVFEGHDLQLHAVQWSYKTWFKTYSRASNQVVISIWL